MEFFSTGPFPEGWTTVVAVSTVLIALANCFFGYRLLKLWIAVAGFFVGFSVGFLVTEAIARQAVIALIVGLLLGAVLAVLSFKVYLCGVFFLCLSTTYSLFSILLSADVWWEYVICLVFAVLVGLISIRFVRPVVIASTALSGGFSAAGTALTAMSLTGSVPLIVCGVLLAAGGMVLQFLTTEKHG